MSVTYGTQSFWRDRHEREAKLMKLKTKALELLREALYAASAASKATSIGNPKKVWKATYEATIASAPTDVREIANFLRNYYGSRTKHYTV